jgi:hypothetical protein
MKTRILTLALLIVTSISSAFANNAEGVSEKALSTFKKEFDNAREVRWEATKEYSKATFKLNDQVMFAYYSTDGDFLALSRNITTTQLPISLSADLKKSYTSMWVSDLFEMASNNQTTYYATVENADQTITLKSTGANGWEVYKKEKKP